MTRKGTYAKRCGALLLVVLLFSLASPLLGAEKRYTIPTEDSPFMGPKDTPVTIVEFIDYQ